VTTRILAWLFTRDLVRRRMLWILVVIVAGVLAFNFYVEDRSQAAENARNAAEEVRSTVAAAFDGLADSFRFAILPFVTFLSVLVAPEARRSGTTQFLLSVPISRRQVARGQFAALAGLLAVVLVVIHVGLGYPGWRVGAMGGFELAVSWAPLLIVALAQAAVVFLLSTTLSTAVTLMVVLIAPWLFTVATQVLLALDDPSLHVAVRASEHARFLFPDLSGLVIWPRPWLVADTGDVPVTGYSLMLGHELLCIGFWSLLALLLYRRFNFGTRNLPH
jgi:ABC-type transport system involved in multi-copper enzyme maturation permease subunit